MARRWREARLEREIEDLRSRLKDCLELIEDLSALETGLFQERRPIEFVTKYVRAIGAAKRALDKTK